LSIDLLPAVVVVGTENGFAEKELGPLFSLGLALFKAKELGYCPGVFEVL